MTKEDIVFNIKYRIMALKSLSQKEQDANKGNLWELEDLLAMIENEEQEQPQGLNDAKIAANLISELCNLKVRGLIKESTYEKYKYWLKTIH